MTQERIPEEIVQRIKFSDSEPGKKELLVCADGSYWIGKNERVYGIDKQRAESIIKYNG